MTGLLDGAVVAVTGAASGIGRATALTAGREGAAALILSDHDAEGLASLTAELADAGTPALAVAGQITDPTLPGRIAATAINSFGRLDAAVNNAGIRGNEATLDVSADETFDEAIDVNLRAIYRCLRAQLQQMYAQGSGAIVNVGSASVFGVAPGLGPYIASKMGIIGLSKVAASEAGPHGVRVNVVAPGRTSTPLLAHHASSSVVGLHDTLPRRPHPAGPLRRPHRTGRHDHLFVLAPRIVYHRGHPGGRRRAHRITRKVIHALRLRPAITTLTGLTAIRWPGATHDPLPAAQPAASALNYGHY